jgi:sortase A
VRTVIRGVGELLVTAGVVVLLFVAYLMWGTALRASGAQHQLSNELNQQWGASGQGHSGAADLPPRAEQLKLVTGQPFAFIRIPAFGPHWRFTIIQGTALAQLNVSPGHVPGTQLPGQVGNFAVAGHRVTAGNPFWSLPSLKNGDLVDIDTDLNTYTYKVTGQHTVLPSDTAVVDPVPGHPGQRPTQRLITLITCNPAWTGTHRVIVTGVLVSAAARSAASQPASH